MAKTEHRPYYEGCGQGGRACPRHRVQGHQRHPWWARNTAKGGAGHQELDYHLNAYARGLKSNRTNTIAVILPTIAHPHFG